MLKNTKYFNNVNNFFEYSEKSTNDTSKLKNIFLSLLNGVKEKEFFLFLLSKIKLTNIYQNNENFLLSILEIGLKNEFIFDHLFNSLSEQKQELFFKDNLKNIIKALFIYGQNNGYIFIKKLIKYINKYMTISNSYFISSYLNNDIKNIIYASKDIEEKISKDINFLDEPIDEFFKHKDKFLFHYCLSKRINVNYETIAVLFDYCPKVDAILDLCPFLYNNIENILKDFKIISYMAYFKKEKNKLLIRGLSTSFYNFSLFIENIYDTFTNFKYTNLEKRILLYYIKINILEIIPNELLFFFDFELNDLNSIDYQEYDKWFID